MAFDFFKPNPERAQEKSEKTALDEARAWLTDLIKQRAKMDARSKAEPERFDEGAAYEINEKIEKSRAEIRELLAAAYERMKNAGQTPEGNKWMRAVGEDMRREYAAMEIQRSGYREKIDSLGGQMGFAVSADSALIGRIEAKHEAVDEMMAQYGDLLGIAPEEEEEEHAMAAGGK